MLYSDLQMGQRIDGRHNDALRPLTIQVGYLTFAEGSALINLGNTSVLCAVTVEDRQPPFLRGTTKGWVTAEYSMLPRSTATRSPRESVSGRIGGRTHEIQRLIGRSLRAVVDLKALGERTFTIDCDVLQADGGTRTASITGAYVALVQAMHKLVEDGTYCALPLKFPVAATSVGVIDGVPMLDLAYEEDSRADVDFNVVMTGEGKYVETQGTAEHGAYTREEMNRLLDLAEKGINESFAAQRAALEAAGLGGR
jgi:ribonuclease PH